MSAEHVLAVDLGTTGLKVGPRVGPRRDRLARPTPPSPPRCSTAAVPSRTPRRGGRSSPTSPARRWPAGGRTGGAGRGGELHGPVGEHGAGRRPTAARSGPAILWMDQRGGAHTRRAIGGPVAGYAPRAIVEWIRRPAARPRRQAPTRSATCSTSSTTARRSPRPPRWYLEPVDYLSMRFTGVAAASHASMTAAWLTDNRHLDRLVYDAGLRAAGRASIPRDCRRCVPTGSVVGTVQPDVAADLGLRPETVGRHRHARPALGGRRRRGRGGLRDAHGDQHDGVDQLPGAVQEDRRAPADRLGARAAHRAAT